MKQPSLDSPIQLSKNALDQLKQILEKEIGLQALKKLSEKEINHIGCFLLTLTSTQLSIGIREYQKAYIDNT